MFLDIYIAAFSEPPQNWYNVLVIGLPEIHKVLFLAGKKNYEEMATEQFSVLSHDDQPIPDLDPYTHPPRRRTIFDPGTDKAAMETAAVSFKAHEPTVPSGVRRRKGL